RFETEPRIPLFRPVVPVGVEVDPAGAGLASRSCGRRHASGREALSPVLLEGADILDLSFIPVDVQLAPGRQQPSGLSRHEEPAPTPLFQDRTDVGQLRYHLSGLR